MGSTQPLTSIEKDGKAENLPQSDLYATGSFQKASSDTYGTSDSKEDDTDLEKAAPVEPTLQELIFTEPQQACSMLENDSVEKLGKFSVRVRPIELQ